jgi:hypothetical protein
MPVGGSPALRAAPCVCERTGFVAMPQAILAWDYYTPWVNQILRGLTGTLERIRIDRQLEEALTHRADPLHLAAVFDLHESTAIRYAASARQLLEEPHETHPSGSPQTQASTSDDKLPEHLSSR